MTVPKKPVLVLDTAETERLARFYADLLRATTRPGSGHGQASAPSGLGVRHARLTANAAVTWCELTLDTMADPNAPWHNSRPVTGPTLTSARTPAP
ncbi:abortive infection family protein [Streptomyces lavendulae]|uniref:abortive infection family protein n=1 Tax=Streptomyces lavendulae TaxID=1914 RepID=UPI0036981D9A